MDKNIFLGNAALEPSEDKFNRWPFSRALADRIASLGNEEGAPVIGIYGRWGYGKTSVLNFIKYQLTMEHRDKIILFEFNPWLFNNPENLLAAFYTELAMKFDIALAGTSFKIGKMLENYGSLLGMVPWGLGTALRSVAERFGKELSAMSLSD